MSTRTPWRLAAGILVISLATVGCKASKKADAKKDAEKAPAAKAEAKSGDAAAPAAKAPGEMSGADQATLDDLAKDRTRRDEMRRFLVQKYSEMGDELYSVGEWEKARLRYSEVLELDAGNAHAARRLEEIGAHLNESGSTAADTFDNLRGERMVKIEQAKLEVANLVESGRMAEGHGDFDEAIGEYEKALVIVDVQPYQVDFTPDGDALRGMIANARARKTKAEQARRQKEFKAARDLKLAEAARSKRQKRATIVSLFRDANQAMEEERYGTAQNLAEQILDIDPTNDQASRLRNLAVRSSEAQYEESIRKSLKEEWKNVFEELQRQVIPQNTAVTFPKTWDIKEGRASAPQFSTKSAFAPDPQAGAINAKLESVRTPLNIGDDQTSIQDLLSHLSDLTGVNIVMDGAALEGKSDEDLLLQPLQLNNPISVREILDLVTTQRGLGWKVANGVVMVTTPEAVMGMPILDLYDVKDITAGIIDFPADDINLQPSGGGGFALPLDDDTEPRPTFEGDAIKDLISDNIDADVWGENGANVEYREPGTLVVKAPASTHAKIRKLLEDLRSTGGMQVSIETRFVTVSDNFLQDIGVDLRGLGDDSLGAGVSGKGTNATFDDLLAGNAAAPAGLGTGNDAGVFYNFIHGSQDLRGRVENLYDVALGKPGVLLPTGGTSVQAVYLDDTQVEAILRAVEKSERSTQVIAPKVTAYNNQRSNVQVLNQVSYIADFDVEIAQLAQIGDPIIQQLQDGVILDIHPVISADKRYITMELRPTVAILQRPIQTFQTTLGNGPPVSIQLPEIRIQRVRTTVTMPDGGTLMLGGLRFYEEQRLDSTVPWLDKIPVLNFFWRRQGTFIERRNLLILLKATIIRLEEHEPRMGRRG
ncbi:MAG: hypothetical protein ACYTG4_02965 [Planctomycetota bacterium]|jgi:hypothetical protein